MEAITYIIGNANQKPKSNEKGFIVSTIDYITDLVDEERYYFGLNHFLEGHK